MMSSPVAARALLFMKQCRAARTSTPLTTCRYVSSSHLAPSNFQRPLRVPQDTQERQAHDIPSGYSSPNTSGQSAFAQQIGNGLRLQRQPPVQTSNRPAPSVPHLPPPITEARSRVPPGFLAFLKHVVFRIPPPEIETTPPPFSVVNNPYKARKSWPPDFRLLHHRQQLHFEKTYRRRLLLKQMNGRHSWDRYIRLLRQTLVVITLIYCLFIADPWKKEGLGTPLDGFRAWFFGQVARLDGMPQDMVQESRQLHAYYDKLWRKKQAMWEGEDYDTGLVARDMEAARQGKTSPS